MADLGRPATPPVLTGANWADEVEEEEEHGGLTPVPLPVQARIVSPLPRKAHEEPDWRVRTVLDSHPISVTHSPRLPSPPPTPAAANELAPTTVGMVAATSQHYSSSLDSLVCSSPVVTPSEAAAIACETVTDDAHITTTAHATSGTPGTPAAATSPNVPSLSPAVGTSLISLSALPASSVAAPPFILGVVPVPCVPVNTTPAEDIGLTALLLHGIQASMQDITRHYNAQLNNVLIAWRTSFEDKLSQAAIKAVTQELAGRTVAAAASTLEEAQGLRGQLAASFQDAVSTPRQQVAAFVVELDQVTERMISTVEAAVQAHTPDTPVATGRDDDKAPTRQPRSSRQSASLRSNSNTWATPGLAVTPPPAPRAPEAVAPSPSTSSSGRPPIVQRMGAHLTDYQKLDAPAGSFTGRSGGTRGGSGGSGRRGGGCGSDDAGGCSGSGGRNQGGGVGSGSGGARRGGRSRSETVSTAALHQMHQAQMEQQAADGQEPERAGMHSWPSGAGSAEGGDARPAVNKRTPKVKAGYQTYQPPPGRRADGSKIEAGSLPEAAGLVARPASGNGRTSNGRVVTSGFLPHADEAAAIAAATNAQRFLER